MCNLYSVTKGQKAMRELYRAMTDRTGNMPPLPGIFPDQMAPVVRSGADGRELVTVRWGFPCPPSVPGNRAVTNIRRVGGWTLANPQGREGLPIGLGDDHVP